MTLLKISLPVALVFTAYAGIALAQPDNQVTLNKCQQTAAKETAKYAAAVQKAAGKCLSKSAALIIKDDLDNFAAASTCAAAFRKLVNTEDLTKTLAAKAEAKIEKICDPAAPDSKALHTAADVLGTGATVLSQPIEADDLGSWCANFGGDGTVNSIQEWIDCQLGAATCQAMQQIAAEYPLALEWLDSVEGDIYPGLGTDQKYVDALIALTVLKETLDSNADGIYDLACGPRALTKTGTIGSARSGDDGDIDAGVPLRYVDNGNGTVTDLNTGLMWEKLCDEDPPGGVCSADHDVDTTYDWDDAFDVKIANLNTASFAGYDDWRVPNVRELNTLVNYGVAGPAITPPFFTAACAPPCGLATCSCTESLQYWSSTPTLGVWFIEFSFGTTSAAVNTSLFRVRAVRGGL